MKCQNCQKDLKPGAYDIMHLELYGEKFYFDLQCIWCSCTYTYCIDLSDLSHMRLIDTRVPE